MRIRARGHSPIVAAVVALVLLAVAPAAAQAVVLADGHVDYAARIVAGQLRSQVKDGTQGSGHVVWREPADVVFGVREAAKTTIPTDGRMRFLGPGGGSVWMIPQVQRSGILWAGWNTEELTSADVSGPVTWTLQAVQGPGTVAVFQTGAFGDPDVIFNSADGLPDSRQIPLATHAHGNWAFSTPGSYRLTFQMSAAGTGGGTLSDTQTLAVQVDGPAPGGSGQPPSDPGQTPGGSGQPSGDRSSIPGGSGSSRPLTLRASRARLRGRTLTFNARISRTSRLDVAVRRAHRVVTRAKPRTVAAATKTRTLRVRLGRALTPGRAYTATVRIRAGGKTATRTLGFRAPIRMHAR